MADQDPRISAMISERSELRHEVVAFEQNIHNTLIYFFTLIGASAGVLFDQKIITDPGVRSILLFSLSQMEIILAFYVVSVMSNVNVHTAYIEALDMKLNKLMGENVALWETSAAGKHLYKPTGPFILSLACVIIFMASFLVILATQSKGLFDNTFIIGFVLLEVVLIFGLILRMIWQKKVAREQLYQELIANMKE